MEQKSRPPSTEEALAEVVPHLSSRPRRSPERWTFAIAPISFGSCDPQSYEKAISSPTANIWKRATDEERNSLVENGTLVLVPRPMPKNVISSKLV